MLKHIIIIIIYIEVLSYICIYRNYIASILIVYVICGRSIFSTYLSQYPVYELRCNNTTNYKDIYEAGLILDFIMKVYRKPLAKKYIFCQGHDISHHYKINFWERVKYITSTEYFINNNYGGIYCIYLHSYKTNLYLKLWAYDVEMYLKRKNILKELISEVNITLPCCATFFLSHSLILSNKYSLYCFLRKELTKYVENNLNLIINNRCTNKRAAMFMEFYWGILFSHRNSVVPFPPDCNKHMKIWK